MEAAKMGVSLVEEEEDENGLKNHHHDMFTVVSVYMVFQFSLFGSLLNSSSNVVQYYSSSWHTPHFYLSLAASLFTLITLVLAAYVAEDMQEAAPPSHRKRRAGECFHVAAYPLLIYAYISMH